MLRDNRHFERGQTLIAAVAFLGMFGLFAAAVLAFASGVQKQRALTEATAAIDSVAEGSAQFAAADTGVQGCGTITSGTMKFASGDTLSFTAGAIPCSPSSSNAPGQNCGLCVLNYANCPPGSSASACTGTPISAPGDWIVPGEVGVNGSVSLNTLSSITGRIGLYGSATTCTTTCSPANSASDGALTINSATASSPKLFTGSANYIGDVVTDSQGAIPSSTTITAENNTNGAVGGLAAHSVTLSTKATATASADTFTLALASASDGTLTKNSTTAGSPTLFANGANLVGDLIADAKGGVPAGTSVTAENNTNGTVGGLAPHSVMLSQKATASVGGDTFTTWLSLSSQILDPLAGALPIPTPALNPQPASGNVCPGTYSDLNGTVNLQPWGSGVCPASTSPSLYIITGNAGGNSDIVANGSTLYFTPTASVSFVGNGNISVDCGPPTVPPSCPSSASTTPTAGPYAGVAMFFDPGFNSTISFKGNGAFFVAGTVEASHAVLSLKGNGGKQSFQGGRLIVSEIQGVGNGGAGLGYGGGTVNSSGCNYWTDKLTGTLRNGSVLDAHVRFESACNSGSPTSIISFAYGDGP
jgi:hypothetical protein